MALATGAFTDMEMRHLDFEQAYLMVDIDTDIYIEVPEEHQEFVQG